MANIARFMLWRHLRAEPNQFILQFKRGRLKRKGAGIAGWYNPLSTALAQVPVEDCETTFLLRERSEDFQEVTVQCTLTYRVIDPEKAAQRVNFSISVYNGAWTEQPMERLASLWVQRAQHPARAYLKGVSVEEAVRAGADVIRTAILDGLKKDTELADMGLTVVNLQVVRVAPSADLEKALQTPTREAIQQRADEAGFSRRANAVEKERAIKQNELQTEIDLAHRQENLIAQQGKNRVQGVNNEADAEKARVTQLLQRQKMEADAYAVWVETRAKGDAEVQRTLAAAAAESEAKRLELYKDAPPKVLLGLALQDFAKKLQSIQHLNVTPDLVKQALEQFALDSQGAPKK